MMVRLLIIVALGLSLTGCAAPLKPVMSSDSPANPDSAEAPLPVQSNQSDMAMPARQAMPSDGGMK